MARSIRRAYGRFMDNVAMIITSTATPGKRDELYELYRQHLAPRAEENEAQQVVV